MNTRYDHPALKLRFVLFVLIACIGLPGSTAWAQTTAITYQGQLRSNGTPYTGMVNLQFKLFDAFTGGTEVASIPPLVNWPVEDGLFQAEVDFGAGAFDGSDRWLEVWVNGAPLTPRQKVTSAPYALHAGSTDWSGIVSVPAGLDDGDDVGWSMTGNAGTDPNTNFIGTTDNQPLVLRTANAQSLRIEPSAETFNGLPITANVIAGSHANNVTPGVRGATIAGGGVPSGNSDPNFVVEAPNRVTDAYGTVGGGYGNRAGDDAGTTNDAPLATVGGGFSNTASSTSSTVGGGLVNTASGSSSTVGGGAYNIASGGYSTVGGGRVNTASGGYSTVGGGYYNCAGGNYSWAGGRRAKVRPGNDAGEAGSGCLGMGDTGTAGGDQGTFIWADSQNATFTSTGSNQFLVRAAGGVGIGTNNPSTQLHVVDTLNTPGLTGHVALIENASTGTEPDVLALKIGTTSTPDGAVNFITFFNGNNQSLGAIQGDNAGGVTLAGPGNDYAEWLPLRRADAEIKAGDLVGWHADGVDQRTDGAIRVMVVSTQPIVAGNAPMQEDRTGWAPLAFVGQAPVRVRGPVRAGDYIIPSGEEDGTGRAVSANAIPSQQLAQVAGVALQTLEEPGEHQVKI